MSNKAEARHVSAALYDEEGPRGGRRHASGCRVGVRVNPRSSSQFQADLLAVAALRPSFVILSKVGLSADIEASAELGLPVVALIESASGVERLAEIAAAFKSIERLGFGALDSCAEIRARRRASGAALVYVRPKRMIFSGRAGLKAPLDSACPELSDVEGLASEPAMAREWGFGGKMAVQPGQLQPIARSFSPTDLEIRRAKRIPDAYEEAASSGQAVFRLGRNTDLALGAISPRRLGT